MKKIVLAMFFVAIAAGVAFVAYRQWRPRRPLPAKAELRAAMKDENAPLSPRPSVGITVNGQRAAAVFRQTPVWFTVGVSNEGAANQSADDAARSRQPRTAAAKSSAMRVTLGDPGHPWTDSVEFIVREGKGGERLLPLSLSRVGAPPRQVLELDGANTAEADFAAPAVSLPPGVYDIAACLRDTGFWKGRACSTPVRLTIAETPAQLTAEQEDGRDRQAAQFASLTADYAALENYGRRLVVRHPDSIAGHMYIGDSKYGQGQWSEALEEYNAARAEYSIQKPNSVCPPYYLNRRISELLDRLDEKP